MTPPAAETSRAAGRDELDRLARSGHLADTYRSASREDRRRLRADAYAVVAPLVFQHLTRRHERVRGHHGCAVTINGLEPDCLDRYHDDVEAVIDDLFRTARIPIANLDGWLVRRLSPAVIDAHRRRRGERGALQRPRLPLWLRRELGGDSWLTALAYEILTWVGVPTTAGLDLWPLEAWTERRTAITGDHGKGVPDTAADIERVLEAMRRRPAWYANFIERPLGRKQAPVLHVRAYPAADAALAQTDWHKADEAHLRALAETAIAAIEKRVRAGEDLRQVVAEVVRVVFGSGTAADTLDRPPGDGPADLVEELMADPAVIDRVGATVSKLVATEDTAELGGVRPGS